MNTKPFRLAFSGLLALTFLASLPVVAQAAGPPRVSPQAEVSQTVGLAAIDIVYSRPYKNERTIWGELVPYDQVWRTGANEATTLELSHDAKVGGKAVPAGTYALFSVPGKDQWTIILNKQADQWGAFQSDEAQDQVRFTVKPRATAATEQFTIGVPAVDGFETATVSLAWDTTEVQFPITFDAKKVTQAVAQAETAEAKAALASAADAQAAQGAARALWGWANYYYTNDLDAAQALEWISLVDQGAGAQNYWVASLHARLLAKNGKPQAAGDPAERAAKAASAEGVNQFIKADYEKLQGEMEDWSSSR